jgi:hypothetical protein
VKRTDKELLELAASAAGLDGYEYVEATEFTYESMQRRNAGFAEDDFFELQADVWSPLTDDGDALRLAVKLKLDIVDVATCVTVWSLGNDDCDEDYGSDPYAATRRAIVRAAAEIGAKL